MNARQRSRTSRLFLLFAIGLLFLTAQLPGSASQVSPDQAGAAYFAALDGTVPLASSTLVVNQRAVLHTPEGIYHGRDGIDAFGSWLQDTFSNLTFVTVNSSASESDIVVHFVMSGTYTGSYHGMATNCAGIRVPGVAVLSFDGSGIAEQWFTYDVDTLVAQIDGFHALDSNHKPDCSNLNTSAPSADPNCVRRDRCDESFDKPVPVPPALPPSCAASVQCRTAF